MSELGENRWAMPMTRQEVKTLMVEWRVALESGFTAMEPEAREHMGAYAGRWVDVGGGI